MKVEKRAVSSAVWLFTPEMQATYDAMQRVRFRLLMFVVIEFGKQKVPSDISPFA
jgi:hypothetical protein